MPDLKLQPLLEATEPERIHGYFKHLFPSAAEPTLDGMRLQAPFAFWATYLVEGRRLTLKSFFSTHDYQRYTAKLVEYYPQQLDHPDHARGGFSLLPELNGILWTFPFDPAMLGLHYCVDGGWVAEGLHFPGELMPEVMSYSAEIGALIRYRQGEDVVAYGKCAPEDESGRLFLIMDRLWRSRERRTGVLRLARPLAYRPEAGLLLQSPVPGAPIPRQRNHRRFLQLVEAAAPALAAIHAADVPFGDEKTLDQCLERLERSLGELLLTAPRLHQTMSLLVQQIRLRVRDTGSEFLVLSHGDFKWDQFLENDGQFTLIDFELFCQAEPAYDLGYFCAYLPPSIPDDWRDGMATEYLRTTFLRRYAEAAGPIDYARVGTYEAASLALRALSHVWAHEPGWRLRASMLLDLAVERLVNPGPHEPC